MDCLKIQFMNDFFLQIKIESIKLSATCYVEENARHTHLNTENTRAILPIARILFLMTSLRKLAALPTH